MKTVIRHDHTPLRKPEILSQGFLRAEGLFARAGIYEYRNDDGSTRYELRPKEEVASPASLASYSDAPVTIGHPDVEVTAHNVKKYEVGSVSGQVRIDGDSVAGAVVVKDAGAIRKVKGGLHELSPGYRIRLDETKGFDKRYGYPGNEAGRFDAIQRDIRVNHLAIVPRARGGASIRLRMDAAEQVRRLDSDDKLTTLVDGHQHLIDISCYAPKMSGCTSWSFSAGKDHGHSHDWIRNPDGTITIGYSEGHTHAILDDAAVANAIPGPRYDSNFDLQGHRSESHNMDKDEMIRSLRDQLAAVETKVAPLQDRAAKSEARADAAEAHVQTLRGEIDELRSQISAAATVVETDAIRKETARADALETELRKREDSIAGLVEARVTLERKASVVLPDANFRGLSARDIWSTVVRRLDSRADIGPGVSDAYLEGRFDALLEQHARNARAHRNISDIVAETITVREDKETKTLTEERQAYRNRGVAPLPNSREAQNTRGRA